MAKILDIYDNEYTIPDLENFKVHINKFHTVNGIPDNSIHEENGYYFKIDDTFYKILLNLK
tara:strand:- start:555 stop:737 length:183 start_codon:yes stop_codon:yes gene_type:complete